YIFATRTRFVQPGKIEIDANERAVIEEFTAAFSFASSSILSLTICRVEILLKKGRKKYEKIIGTGASVNDLIPLFGRFL
ncbi:MAG: hypothetical protein IK115_06155, partial [Lachnospiraceae bacterium]|nr:hypothetical protein [Lachnospiraceae bacterium]